MSGNTWHPTGLISPGKRELSGVLQALAFPPLVSRTGIEVGTVARIKEVFETMHKDPAGKSLLAELKLDEFRQYPSSLFNNTRKMMNLIEARDAWPAAVVID